MLGHRLAIQAAKEGFEILGTYHRRPVKIKKVLTLPMDITSLPSITKVYKEFQPEAVIHTAAMTNVDLCEEKPEEAFKVNAAGSKNLVQACENWKTKLVYISTDYVFDGEKGNYNETDEPRPLSIYAQSKLAGEKEVTRLSEALIFRCTIYGWHLDRQKSIPEWVIDNLEKKKKIKAFTDRIISPIYTGDLSKIIIEALKKNLRGIYHTASKEAVSVYHFAFKVAEVFELDKDLIEGGRMDEVTLKARRPKNSSLSPKKIEKTLAMEMPSVESGLRKMKEEKELGKEWLE